MNARGNSPRTSDHNMNIMSLGLKFRTLFCLSVICSFFSHSQRAVAESTDTFLAFELMTQKHRSDSELLHTLERLQLGLEKLVTQEMLRINPWNQNSHNKNTQKLAHLGLIFTRSLTPEQISKLQALKQNPSPKLQITELGTAHLFELTQDSQVTDKIKDLRDSVKSFPKTNEAFVWSYEYHLGPYPSTVVVALVEDKSKTPTSSLPTLAKVCTLDIKDLEHILAKKGLSEKIKIASNGSALTRLLLLREAIRENQRTEGMYQLVAATESMRSLLIKKWSPFEKLFLSSDQQRVVAFAEQFLNETSYYLEPLQHKMMAEAVAHAYALERLLQSSSSLVNDTVFVNRYQDYLASGIIGQLINLRSTQQLDRYQNIIPILLDHINQLPLETPQKDELLKVLQSWNQTVHMHDDIIENKAAIQRASVNAQRFLETLKKAPSQSHALSLGADVQRRLKLLEHAESLRFDIRSKQSNAIKFVKKSLETNTDSAIQKGLINVTSNFLTEELNELELKSATLEAKAYKNLVNHNAADEKALQTEISQLVDEIQKQTHRLETFFNGLNSWSQGLTRPTETLVNLSKETLNIDAEELLTKAIRSAKSSKYPYSPLSLCRNLISKLSLSKTFANF